MQRSIGKEVAVRKPQTTSQPLYKRHICLSQCRLGTFCIASQYAQIGIMSMFAKSKKAE